MRGHTLTASAIALVALTLPASAIARPAPRLSLHRAEHAIVHAVGPGTTTTSCTRLSATAIRCSYSTPTGSVGIHTEDPTSRWYSRAIARLSHGRVKVSATSI